MDNENKRERILDLFVNGFITKANMVKRLDALDGKTTKVTKVAKTKKKTTKVTKVAKTKKTKDEKSTKTVKVVKIPKLAEVTKLKSSELKPKIKIYKNNKVLGAKGRPIKRNGRAYKRDLDIIRKREIKERRKFRSMLKQGDLNGAYGLVRNQVKFNDNDLINLQRILGANSYFLKVTILDVSALDVDNIRYLTVNPNSWTSIKRLLKNRYWLEEQVTTGSDAVDFLSAKAIISIEFENTKGIKTTKLFKNKAGKFFKYINETDIDLTRYQVLRKTDNFKEILNENCIIYALRILGIDEAKLNAVKLAFEDGTYVAKKNLNEISRIIGYNIKLYKLNKHGIMQPDKVYGKEAETLTLAIYKDHYFIYEETEYSTYGIKNYSDVKHLNFSNIIKYDVTNSKYIYKREKRKCNSLKLLKILMDSGYMNGSHELLDDLDSYQNNDMALESIPLTNIINEQREKIYEEKKTDKSLVIFFADFESFTGDEYHEGFLSGISPKDKDEVKIFRRTTNNTEAWITNMFDYVKRNTPKGSKAVIYFHNAKYDFNLLLKHTEIRGICEKGTNLYNVTLNHYGCDIEIRDTYKYVSIKLSEFNDTFGLPAELNKKEAIGYSYYTPENYNDRCVKVEDYIKHVSHNKDQLYDNCKLKENGVYLFDYDSKNHTFDPIKYYEYYLKYDVLVLKYGIKKFEETIKNLTDLDLYDSLTISSLANKFMCKNGAFDSVYEVCGNLREYLSKAIYGGRVNLMKEHQKKVITKKIADYDACSLYPSAIARMCKESGSPVGKCKRIVNKNKKELDQYDYYVTTVKITKINKTQQMPFICERTKDSMNYINEVPKGGLVCVIDKITLEDYIKFHDIDYEILDGVYWNSGTNKKFGDLIDKLYNDRKIEKKLMKTSKTLEERNGHNNKQASIKLMLNSAYGKTILSKTNDTSIFMKVGQMFDNYRVNNFHLIKSYEYVNDTQVKIKMLKSDTSYNMSHVGVMVLSYSKRIMNEVMDLANTEKMPIYYQDTDSMHMNYDDVKGLEDKYREVYGKELNGGDMGQFHIDFDLSGSKGEIFATESIFLGKKSYIDRLESSDGKTGYHSRLKGITEAGISDMVTNNYGGDIFKMYEDLATGKALEMCLNPEGKVLFEYANSKVRTREKFTRVVKF